MRIDKLMCMKWIIMVLKKKKTAKKPRINIRLQVLDWTKIIETTELAHTNKISFGTLSVSCFRENFSISYGYTRGCYYKTEGLHSNAVLEN